MDSLSKQGAGLDDYHVRSLEGRVYLLLVTAVQQAPLKASMVLPVGSTCQLGIVRATLGHRSGSATH